MRRTIIEPANVSGTALAELKAWLGISRPNDDDLLIGLLQASLAMFEAFTGQAALSLLIEERISAQTRRHTLTSRPVTALETVEIIHQDGSSAPLDGEAFELVLNSDGSACFTLAMDLEGQAVAIRVRGGISDSWISLPPAIKQGLIRLSAFYYRDRDRTGNARDDGTPPASVTAFWRPWRRLGLQ